VQKTRLPDGGILAAGETDLEVNAM